MKDYGRIRKPDAGGRRLNMKAGLSIVTTVGAGTNCDPEARDNESSRRRQQRKWSRRARRNCIKRGAEALVREALSEGYPE